MIKTKTYVAVPYASVVAKLVQQPYTGDCGLYVCRVPQEDSRKRLVEHAANCGIHLDEAEVSDLHVTVVYSKTPVPIHLAKPTTRPCSARVSHVEHWPGHNNKGYLVAVLKSPALDQAHQLWASRGATPTFSPYVPHVTLKTGVPVADTTLGVANRYFRDHSVVLTFGPDLIADLD